MLPSYNTLTAYSLSLFFPALLNTLRSHGARSIRKAVLGLSVL